MKLETLAKRIKKHTYTHKTKNLHIADPGIGIAYRITETGSMRCTGMTLEDFLMKVKATPAEFTKMLK